MWAVEQESKLIPMNLEFFNNVLSKEYRNQGLHNKSSS